MIAGYCAFEETCARLCVDFFDKRPNDDPRDRVSVAMAALLKPGRPSPERQSGR